MRKPGFFLLSITHRSFRSRNFFGVRSKVSPRSPYPGFSREISMPSLLRRNTGGNFSHYASKSSFFSDFILSNNLFDLGFSGSRFTWCNGQTGHARHWVRLDLFLANSLWLLDFQHFSNLHLPRILSDHSPLFLSAFKFACYPIKNFHFDNCWLDYAGCHESVIRA